MSQSRQQFSADRPITDPSQDRLGYSQFAQHIADIVHTIGGPEGLVISINAPWGSGKTSALRLVEYYLQQLQSEGRPLIVRFNPWWFSGTEDLVGKLLDQIRANLSGNSQVIKTIRVKLADYAGLVASLPIPIPYVSDVGKAVEKAARPPATNIYKLKEKIDELLTKASIRMLIIIDDIDRLTSEEIRQLFRAIKAIADFPNSVYLLAFDQDIVIEAMSGLQGVSGSDYLQKIVQLSLHLPEIDQTVLRKLFFEKLDLVLSDTIAALFDQVRWANVYFDGIDHFLSTPRDIVRLINSLEATYPTVRGEVNAVDFVAMETLRAFCPQVYTLVGENKAAFTGRMASTNGVTDPKQLYKPIYDQVEVMARPEDIKAVKGLLVRLFPKLEVPWQSGGGYSSGFDAEWRKQLRVCSPDHISTYFRFSLLGTGLSNARIRALVEQADNAKVFGSELVKLVHEIREDGTSNARTFLERLEDYTGSDITLEQARGIVEAFFDVGDQLWRSGDKLVALFDFGNEVRISRVIYQCLRRFENPSRFEILCESIRNGDAITTVVDIIIILGQALGKYGSQEDRDNRDKLVDNDQLAVLEKIGLEKVRRAASDGMLLQVPILPTVLSWWLEVSRTDEVQMWVKTTIQDKQGLRLFVLAVLQKPTSQTIGDRVARSEFVLTSEYVERFIEPQLLAQRIREVPDLLRDTTDERKAVDLFLQEVSRD